LGRKEEAVHAYDEAIGLTVNQTEERFLRRRRTALG
jgi:RNA polymerase sigma-70 factor (ECF subfamily)